MKGLRRLIERELVEGLRPRRRRALIERLRGNASERGRWDRAIAALRVLEQREVSRAELDMVERWLFEDLEAEGVVAGAPASGARRWAGPATWLAGAASLASAAALLVWLGQGPAPEAVEGQERQGSDSPEASELSPRGPGAIARPLALDLICGRPPRPARARGCALDELLGFSLRLRSAEGLGDGPLHLSLFGLDGEGELLYYLPTPDEPETLELRAQGSWQPLPMSVRLEVNHAPGQVRVFALASDAAPSLAQLERWAPVLAALDPASVDDLPWHLRLSPELLASVCARPERCASAETRFVIHPRTHHEP